MKILATLRTVNEYMKSKGYTGEVSFRGETSHLVRAANNQISLNTSEQGAKFFITLQEGKKFSNGSIATSVENADAITKAIDVVAAKLQHVPEIEFATPMEAITQEKPCTEYYDEKLEHLDSAVMKDFFAEAVKRFAGRKTAVSGAFSCGMYEYGLINTLVSEPLYYKGSDFNIELVLQIEKDKKEIRASQVGETYAQYKPEELYTHIEQLLSFKETTPREDITPGSYDIIFGRDAVADIAGLIGWLAVSGEVYEYGMGMMPKDKFKFGDKVFSDKLTIIDDPESNTALFRRPFGLNGTKRGKTVLFDKGIWKTVMYSNKMDADRFGKKVDNDMNALNPVILPGDGPATFEEMIASCTKPTIYIPYIHYVNIPNRAKGEFTGSSRFGTLLIENGKVKSHLYNLRINETVFNFFGKIEWLSKKLEHSNTSNTYGLRMAESVALPAFMKVCGISITGTSNVKKEL